MILGFKKRFVYPIEDGTKKHTFREDKNDRWRVGMKIHMATGVRTKNYNKFREETCLGIQKVEIKWKNPPADSFSGRSVKVYIDGKDITNDCDKLDLLIKNDGFEDRLDFFSWFISDFSGKIIHWTNLKY